MEEHCDTNLEKEEGKECYCHSLDVIHCRSLFTLLMRILFRGFDVMKRRAFGGKSGVV